MTNKIVRSVYKSKEQKNEDRLFGIRILYHNTIVSLETNPFQVSSFPIRDE